MPPNFNPRKSSSISSQESHYSQPGSDNVVDNQILVVSCYSDFSKLAHGPRGKEAQQSLFTYRFNSSDGSMVLLSVKGDSKSVINPAFSRFHPRLNVLYCCTEDVGENGKIFAYSVAANGSLEEIGHVDAGGTSTCYLTIDQDQNHLLAVNYWDSTLVSIPLSQETGAFIGAVTSKYDPKHGKGMVSTAKCLGGANHSCNDEGTIKQRQADPHSHALVLDPYVGCIAYVPCLGKDVIREFHYDTVKGAIREEINSLPSGVSNGYDHHDRAHGPRYLCFHPRLPICYVVNELSSTVAVFMVNRQLIMEMHAAIKANESLDKFKGKPTLKLIQSIQTIPSAFPNELNTCGRICIHESGRFVIVSNRGHQSIAILKVNQNNGQLSTVGNFHTRGETPRHFKFDKSGQYLIVANQDSNNLSIFNFNQYSGEIKFTGNEYQAPSPNFICCCSLHNEDTVIMNDYDEIVVFEVDSDLEAATKKLQKRLKQAEEEVQYLKSQIAVSM